MINKYLRLYPKEHIDEMLIRLESADRHISQSAYFEIFCYGFLCSKGFEIELHPIVKNSKRPDFKVYNDKISFYLEATVIAQEGYKKIENAQKRLVAYLKENLKDCKYCISISFCKINTKRELKKEQLKGLILRLAENLADADYLKNVHKFEDNGWIIKISFFDKANDYSKSDIVSIYPSFPTKEDYRYVQNSLKKKASKYGKLELPYILATCYYSGNINLNEGDLTSALLGRQVYIPKLGKTVRETSGLWYADKSLDNSKNRTLSGVLFFNASDSNCSCSPKPKFFRNPWAKNPILLEDHEVENVDAEIKYVKR